MDRDEIQELLGAYALDAVDDEERRIVEAFLETDPAARAEVQAHREAAAMLSAGSPPAPPAVWERIMAAIDVPAPVPGPRLTTVLPPARRARWAAPLLVAAAAVAVVVAGVVVVAFSVGDDEPGGGRQSADMVEQAYGEAWADPEGRRAQLISEDESFTADAVVRPDGLGFVAANGLPTLPPAETYQLWGVYADGDVISLGVLGNRPGIEPFTATGDVDGIVITHERDGSGVVSSTSGALLEGDLG